MVCCFLARTQHAFGLHSFCGTPRPDYRTHHLLLCVAVFASKHYPQWAIDLLKQDTEGLNDFLMRESPLWFRSFVYCEVGGGALGGRTLPLKATGRRAWGRGLVRRSIWSRAEIRCWGMGCGAWVGGQNAAEHRDAGLQRVD